MAKIGSKDERGYTTVADFTDGGKKAVNVEFLNTRDPQFTFTGSWTGHDIKAVAVNLRRAYLKHNLSLRKNTSEQTKEVTLTKES